MGTKNNADKHMDLTSEYWHSEYFKEPKQEYGHSDIYLELAQEHQQSEEVAAFSKPDKSIPPEASRDHHMPEFLAELLGDILEELFEIILDAIFGG